MSCMLVRDAGTMQVTAEKYGLDKDIDFAKLCDGFAKLGICNLDGLRLVLSHIQGTDHGIKCEVPEGAENAMPGVQVGAQKISSHFGLFGLRACLLHCGCRNHAWNVLAF